MTSRCRAALAAILLVAGSAGAVQAQVPPDASLQQPIDGWTLFLDNDSVVPGSEDRDYTGGMALTIAGRHAQDWWFSLDPMLARIDRWVRADGPAPLYAIQVGMLSFTPEDLGSRGVVVGDRPYASLVHWANSRLYVPIDARSATHTSLSVGVLGLDASKAIARVIHAALDVSMPRGWDHQISDDGEPTFRYAWTRHNLVGEGGSFDLKSVYGLSAGYLTAATVALTGRWGAIRSPWWAFMPESSEYIQEAAAHPSRAPEVFVWGGVRAQARLYNVFLQGQFRDTDLDYAPDQVRPLVLQARAGITRQLERGWGFTWMFAYQTSELQQEPGDREQWWGGLFVFRNY